MKQDVIYLPSCGTGLVIGIKAPPGIPRILTCIDVTAPSPVVVGETISIKAALRERITRDPIPGMTLYYRIVRGAEEIVPPTAVFPTGALGGVKVDFTIPEVGGYRLLFVFLGQDEGGFPLLTIPEGFALCPLQGIISCVSAPQQPMGQCDNIGCGCSLSQDLHGLEPE